VDAKDDVLLLPINCGNSLFYDGHYFSIIKDEVLPIFPPLLNLPPEKFQLALAHILQVYAYSPIHPLIATH